MLWRRVKEFTVADLCSEQEDLQPLESGTAVLMPICNENVVAFLLGSKPLSLAGGDFRIAPL